MSMTDPIADMLSRIRNSMAARQNQLSLPYSSLKENVAKILKNSNFLDEVSVEPTKPGKTLTLVINQEGANPRITELKRLSKPGRRIYVSAAKIPLVKRGRGLVIVSTSKGLMTGQQAKAAGLGGELICEVF